RRARRPMRLVGASGQLGYGVPTPAFEAALARQPDLIGADMGSIDIGPTYLGKGEMATSPAATRRDLRKALLGARSIDVPLVIGSAGSAGAAPHLEATLAIVREIARADGLHFRLGVIRADLPRPMLLEAVRAGKVRGIDDMPALTEEDVTEAAQLVGQMGMGPFRRALAEDIDVLIAGRACDTAIFASLPTMLGYPTGLSVHMAKIIECASLCCLPGGRDCILAELDDEGFVLESMNPQRRATPVSVAAHSLYEQADPFTVYEPEGRLDLSTAHYAAVDDRRTRVTGARWAPSPDPCVKMEGARKIGERAVLLSGAADPRFIAQHRELLAAVSDVVRDLVCEDTPQDYTLRFRVYGVDGVRMAAPPGEPPPGEVFVMGECIAPTGERAAEVVRTCKQYLLHHGYAGRLSTAGNLAFPFTPPEVSLGPAYRFNVYHLLHTPDPDALFPLEIETL
ncbi:MAG TPA: acyclic terpene utilization AtuA family protein, partial [Acetobacteraceae bacterium]|nr:acyclic terpene utilization AtuA family protein [Acetobacteraceae bacterium]